MCWNNCGAVDHIGIYFDTNADVYCMDPPQPAYYTAYVTIIDPSSPEILGVEFRLGGGGTGMGSFWSGAQWLADTSTTPSYDEGYTTGYHVMFNTPLGPESTIVPIMACDMAIAWD